MPRLRLLRLAAVAPVAALVAALGLPLVPAALAADAPAPVPAPAPATVPPATVPPATVPPATVPPAPAPATVPPATVPPAPAPATVPPAAVPPAAVPPDPSAVPTPAGAGAPTAPATPPAAPPPFAFPGEGRIARSDGTTMYFYRTNFIKPQELVDTVGTLLKLPGVTLKAFPRGNQVILEGSEEAIETALDAFAYFDIADAQVYVEAKIVEVTYDNDFEFGLSWLMDRDQQGPNTFFRGGSGTLNPPSFFQSQLPGNLPFQGVGAAFGFVGKEAEKYGLFDLTLQALQLDGTAEILSRPSIVATEGIQAEVRTLQKTPIIQIRNAQSNPSGETLLLETSYIDTKIGLDVKPLFIGDGFVKLEISPTVSTVTGFSVGNGGTSAPIISDRSAKTTITMADGDTFVIGGLYTDSTLKDTAKVPFLGDIPGLGALFTRTRDQKVKTELIFEITPHILRKRTDFKIITPPAEKERLEGAGGGRCPPKAPPR